MCGIGGILRIDPPGVTPPPLREAIPERWLDLLDSSIRHRGPDGHGRFRDRARRADGSTATVAMVHRRLSILDHAGGAQPMLIRGEDAGGARIDSAGIDCTGDDCTPLLFHGSPNSAVDYRPVQSAPADRLAIVFNGCIYNHRELRRELAAAGHTLTTDHSDTEVIPHEWRRNKWRLLDTLEGMYAAAIWDAAEAEIVLIRDRFGEKPLYAARWERDGVRLGAWSSSVPGLIAVGEAFGIPQTIRPLAVRAWIADGAFLVLPQRDVVEQYSGSGRYLLPTKQQGRGSQFGSLPTDLQSSKRPLDADTVEAQLRASVHQRLEADVPLGCFLSGGIDSALIAAFARQVRPDISAFTVRMPVGGYDESADAAATAHHLGIKHHILDCHPDPVTDLESQIRALGLPFGDSSLLPTTWVSRAARNHVTVALGGDGGDDLFLGYERQLIAPLLTAATWLPSRPLRAAARVIERTAHPRSRRSKLARLLNAAAATGYDQLIAIFPAPLLDALVEPQPGPDHGSVEAMRRQHGRDTRLDDLNYLEWDLLRKADTATMSCALELRSPFLDSTLARSALTATRESLLLNGQRKGLLREVARRYFPAEIVDRPKRGFAIPIGEWFRSDFGGLGTLLSDTLHSADPFPESRLGLRIRTEVARRFLHEHLTSRRDHSQRLYMLLVLAIWARSLPPG